MHNKLYYNSIKTIVLLFFFTFIHLHLFSQVPNTYHSSKNDQYWKNRKPVPGYWQQDVNYEIKARLNDTTGIIDASEKLTYWNNSPNELKYVFFHLYQNAFQPDSYLDNLQKNNRIKPKYGKYESQGLGTKVEKISINGVEVKTELDNTILKVYLSQPLKSGDSLTFDIQFKTFFDTGSTRRRMKTFNVSQFKHFDGVLWYPRICVYDNKFGWVTDQHLNREFYGDFGAFNVELTLANHYIVEATGTLLNASVVLPDSLRKKLDIKNFAKKPYGSPPSVIIKSDGSYKTWKYYAENVHDFAFTADPTYRIGEAEWNGIKCIAVAQETHAGTWQNAAEYTAKIIRTYSEDIGMYAYPKMVVADAMDGMEYPMLTLDSGYDPQYRPLLCHEIGHNWFYGMVGSNETYRAFMDEGFTQFLTVWSLNKLEGIYDTLLPSRSKYVRHFTTLSTFKNKRMDYPYFSDAIQGKDGFLNTHSDYFNGALGQGGGYHQVYSKTGTMLYNLQYVLGDSLFLSSMQQYFQQWKMCHPYPEDFRNSIIHFTKVDLNWFFDQWLETDKRIDYGIQRVKKNENENEYTITFIRKERMQMPVDFQVKAKDGKQYDFHIPNTWFVKKTDATVLPKWTGWDKLNPTYEARVIIPEGISDVVIDTTNRLADINMLNNRYKFPLSLALDARIVNYPDRTKYELKARPDIWYNGFDGMKAGIHMNGSYMNYNHVFDLSIWFNSGLWQQNYVRDSRSYKFDDLSYRFNYKIPLDKINKNASFYVNAKHLDGLNSAITGIDKNIEKTRFYLYVKTMYRPNASSQEYLLYQDEWDIKKYNNTITMGLDHSYSYTRGKGRIEMNLRSNALGSDYNYNYFNLKVVNNNVLGKFDFNTRTFLQFGMGTSIPKESALYLAGANPEEMMENKYTRSRGFVDNTWLGYDITTNHFQQGGGLNLRGYAGYLAPHENKNGTISMTYKGLSGASVSAELGFDRFLPIKPKITKNWLKIHTYLFADGGMINSNDPGGRLVLADFRADAGLGTAFTIKKFGALQQIKPLTIRIDFPLFLSATPAVDPDYFKMRWVVGVNRTF